MKVQIVNDNLVVNGVPSYCPFVPPFVGSPGLSGSPSIQRLPCSVHCALCVISGTRVSLHCGGQTLNYLLNELEVN